MRGRTRCIAVALAALLVALPSVGAQNSGITLTLDPPFLEAARDVNTTIAIYVNSTSVSPQTIHFLAQNVTGDLNVSFARNDVSLLPGATERVNMNVRGSFLGHWQVEIKAEERSALGGVGATQKALFRIHIVETPSNQTGSPPAGGNSTQPPAPPGNGTVTGSPPPSGPTNETTNAPPANETGNGNTTSPPPENNTSTGNATSVPQAGAENSTGPSPPPPNETTSAPAHVTPPEHTLQVNATSINVTAVRGDSTQFSVEIENPADLDINVSIALRLPLGWNGALATRNLLVPARGSVLAPAQATPGASASDAVGTLEVHNGTRRLTVQLLLHVVDAAAIDEGVPPDGTARPSAPDTSAPPSLPSAPTIFVTPSLVKAAPGESVFVTLTIDNPTSEPIQGVATLTIAPLEARTSEPTFTVAPGSSTFVVFVLPFGLDLEVDSEYAGEGRVTISGAPDVEPAPLRALVVAPTIGENMETKSLPRTDESMLLAGAALAAGASTLGLAALWRRWPGIGLFALYARLAPRRALEHPRRIAMLDLVRSDPGLALAHAQKRLGLSNGVARHHLALLEAAGVVRSVQDGALRRIWPMEMPRVDATPALRERALAALSERGELRAAELAEHLGVSRQALHYHLKKLEEEGRVVAQREGNEVKLRAA